MTPLAFVQSIARNLAMRGLPLAMGADGKTPEVHAQLGDMPVPCAGTYVTILTRSEVDMGGACGIIEMADVVIIAARDCANVANDDGTTNWEAQDDVSASMDHDAEAINSYVDGLRGDGVYRTSTPATTWMITGGLSMVTVTAQLPVP